MPKLLRILFLLFASTALLAQAAPEIAFTREFGAPLSTGSFRARFSRIGGGLVWLQMMDHFVSLDAARKNPPGPDDYLLLAANGGDHALRLLLSPASTSFPFDPLAEWAYEALDDGVRFSLDSGTGLVLEKTLRHDAKLRGFLVDIVLRNKSSQAVGSLDLELLGPALVNATEASLFGNLGISIAAPREGDAAFVVPAAGKIQDLAVDPKALAFAGSTNRFFGAFLWPLDDGSRDALTGFKVETGPAQEVVDGDLHVHANSGTRIRYGIRLAVPAQNAETKLTYGLYLGPKSFRVFETLPQPQLFLPVLDHDLNPPCCGGITVPGGRMMAKLLIKLLGWFHSVIGNWGFAIMMLTLLVRGLMAPLNFHMQKSMRAYGARMAVLKPKLDALKTKYGDDKQAYQQAMIALQREHKMIPPIGGCLPIFLTMPIYIGLFTALRTAYDVRQQPFIGWIEDLSRADGLFALPFWPHQFNLLPLLWIGMFIFQQLRMPLPTDPQARQMQSMMRYMPILFGLMLYNYASALMVYMVTSMMWSMLESAIVKRVLGPIDPNVAVMAPSPM